MHHERGFTIIELIVVIAIIAVLATIVVAGSTQYLQKGKDARAESDLRSIEVAARIDYINTGRWAADSVIGFPPCFAEWGCQYLNGDETEILDYPQTYFGSFDASYYCNGCGYDWQNWSGDGMDCIVIDIVRPWSQEAGEEEVMKRRCISIDRCPDYCTTQPYPIGF